MSTITTRTYAGKWRKLHPAISSELRPVSLLIRLLAEYTLTLTTVCNRYVSGQASQFLFTVIIPTCILSIAAISVILLDVSHWKELIHLAGIPISALIILTVMITVGISLMQCCVFLNLRAAKRNKAEKAEVLARIGQLEKLIRHASQIEDQGIKDFGQRIELDFRLSDAEAVVNYARAVAQVPENDDLPYMNQIPITSKGNSLTARSSKLKRA